MSPARMVAQCRVVIGVKSSLFRERSTGYAGAGRICRVANPPTGGRPVGVTDTAKDTVNPPLRIFYQESGPQGRAY